MAMPDRRAAAAAAVRALGHQVLVEKAQTMMPALPADEAHHIRHLMLAGPGAGLRDALIDLWRRGVA